MIFKSEHSTWTDERLMISSADGDNKAFTELYDRYVQKLVNYFARMLWGDREKAIDMTHDLFTKIIKKPELYSEGKKFSTWIYSIASNMCKNEYRSHEVRKRHESGVKEFYSHTSHSSTGDIDKSDFKDSLNQELQKLDHEKRCSFIMRYKQGLSIKEIADVMNCSEGTVKSRLFYTLKILSKELVHFDPKNQ